MITVRYVLEEDFAFWYRLDRHMPEAEFHKKVRDRQGYVLLAEDRPVGILRYGLFWDNTPFCNLLFVEEPERRRGYGRRLMTHWEEDMRNQGYGMVMVSTHVETVCLLSRSTV